MAASRAEVKRRQAQKRILTLTGAIETAHALDRISHKIEKVALKTANIGKDQFLELVGARTLMSKDTGALFESIGYINQPVGGFIGRAIRTKVSGYQLITSGGLEEDVGTVAIGGPQAPYSWYAHGHAAERAERFWWGSRGGGSSPLRDMRHLYAEQIFDAVDKIYHWGAAI